VHHDCNREPPEGHEDWWLTADPEHPEGDLHQNAFGTAVNAFTTYATLTGRNPTELDFVVQGDDTGGVTTRYLAERSWTRASARLQ
jgi:hypothetical protein